MPLPREVLPGRTYMITRRCTQRKYLLRPDDATNNAFIYCLTVAAERTGIVLLFTATESNHHHTGIFDPQGNYPLFIEHFHKLLAKCMNSLRKRWEKLLVLRADQRSAIGRPRRCPRQNGLCPDQSL